MASTTLAHERGTNFPFKEEVVHEGYLSRLFATAAANGSFDDPAVADALVDAYVSLVVLRTHNWRTLSQLGRGGEPGPESSWVKLTWSDMTQQMSQTALAVMGTERRPLGAVAASVVMEQVGQRGRRDLRGPAQRDRGADSRASPRAEEISVPVHYEPGDDHVVWITIDRPEAMNSLDMEHFAQLRKAWDRFGEDDESWVAIITGVGNAFCVGADLKTYIPQITKLQKDIATRRGPGARRLPHRRRGAGRAARRASCTSRSSPP